MHYAKLSESKRLQRVMNLLSDFKAHSTLDIIQRAGICAVNSAISELRANNIPVECKYVRRTEDGNSVFEYRLLRVSEIGQVELAI